MAIQRKLNMRFLSNIILLFIVVVSHEFIIKSLRMGYALHAKKALVIKSIVVEKKVIESSDGFYDRLYLEFMLDSSKIEKGSVLIPKSKNKKYDIGDSIAIITSKDYPSDFEAADNLDWIGLNVLVAIVLIFFGLYGVFEFTSILLTKGDRITSSSQAGLKKKLK